MAFKIRLFVNNWTVSTNGDQSVISDPIDDFLNNVSLSGPFSSSNYYSAFNVDPTPGASRPNKSALVKLCRGDILDAEWNTLAGLAQVKDMPALLLTTPTSTIKGPTQGKVNTALSTLGLPNSMLDAALTWGDFLHDVLIAIGSDDQTFGVYETAPYALEWA